MPDKITYKILNKASLPKAEMEFEVEVGADDLNKKRAEALKKIASSLDISGFRKGFVPEKIALAKVGELAVLERAAEEIINSAIPEIVETEKIRMIAWPNISITKIAAGNPLVFKIKFAILPEVKLPDYKKIAAGLNGKKETEPKVEAKEVEEVIAQIQKSFAGAIAKNETAEKKTGEAEKLPEITDEFVKKIGAFKDVADFKNKISENLLEEKKSKARSKKRIEMAEKILAGTETETPEILIDSELVRMEARLSDQVAQAGLKLEDYLKQIKKTTEDLRKEWRPDAEKQAKLQMVLNKIAGDEKLFPDEKIVETETHRLLDEYKGADHDRARAYIETILTNEKVFEFLEDQK